MNRELTLGIDVDGVLYDFDSISRFIMSWVWGYDLNSPSPSWDFVEDSVVPAHWEWLWNEGITEHGLFRHGHCIKGGIEVIRNLHKDGHSINFITACPPLAEKDRREWLQFHIGSLGVPYNLYFTSNKWEIPCDLYLDDKVENCEELKKRGKNVLLFNQPHNVERDWDGERVYNWDDFYSLIYLGMYPWK